MARIWNARTGGAARPLRRGRRLLLYVALAVAGMAALAYAQSAVTSAFSLNSPVTFPVDI